MTKPQITELLNDLKLEADKRNVAIDESFVEQLLILKREGKERSADSQKVKDALGRFARTALTEASEAGDARVGARELIKAFARNDDPWDLGTDASLKQKRRGRG